MVIYSGKKNNHKQTKVIDTSSCYGAILVRVLLPSKFCGSSPT